MSFPAAIWRMTGRRREGIEAYLCGQLLLFIVAGASFLYLLPIFHVLIMKLFLGDVSYDQSYFMSSKSTSNLLSSFSTCFSTNCAKTQTFMLTCMESETC